jgi:hypothetical protein
VDAGEFCFDAIAGGTLTPSQSSVNLGPSGGGSNVAIVDVTLRDGGDSVPLPYYPFACAITTAPKTMTLDVTVLTNSNGDTATGVGGTGRVQLTRTDPGPVTSDSTTVTCTAIVGKAVTTTITVNAFPP